MAKAKAKHHVYTREELIAICEQAIVPQDNWSDRDSQSAQSGVGKCWALLKAGCDFQVTYEVAGDWKGCVTDDRTIWLHVYSQGFNYYEYGLEGNLEQDHFYLPTLQRLEDRKGNDWY